MAKTVEKKALKKGQAKFNLVGCAKVNDFTFKIDEQSKNSDWVYNVLNLGVDCGMGNTVYCEMMGGYGAERENKLYAHGIKKNESGKDIDDYEHRIEVAWEDRTNEEILETIGQGCFITVGLEKDSKDKVFVKRFLSAYDAIEYIKENLTDGTVVNVKGNLKHSIYNENPQMKKEVNSIFLSKAIPVKDTYTAEEEKLPKFKATFTQTILLDKDSIGKVDKEKAVFPIYARVIDYTKEYNGKLVKGNVPFNKNFEFEVNKENPELTKKILEKLFKVKKGITELTVEGDIVEGATTVAVSEDDIPQDIKDLIEMGVFSMDDAKGKMAVSGNREKRLIIRRPVIQMQGAEDNKVPVILKTEEQYSEEDLFLDCMIESEDDVVEEKKETKSSSKKSEKVVEEVADDTAWLDALSGDDDGEELPF